MTDPILTEVRDHVLRITFNRPDRKNAINQAMYALMNSALKSAADDPDVRCVLFTGVGSTYSAGNDVSEFAAAGNMDWAKAPVAQFVDLLVRFPKPLVAAITGMAIGIAVTKLFHFDFVYVADDARLRTPFTQLALCPEAGSSYLLPLLVGQRKAAELLMAGDLITGAQAVGFGLANAALPADQVLAAAEARVAGLCALPPASVRVTKQLMRAGLHDQLGAHVTTEWEALTTRAQSPELKEAVSAFFDKRKPDFSTFT